MLSIDFSQPMRSGIPTADPLDPAVREWWKKTAARVWAAIPDLAGFLVKADSEGRPGPFTYGRNHADGANMLAEAVRPYGGVIVWRCFVYNCRQDWRDTATDRPKAAWEHYAFLDGQFADNVILQVKHGPFDFQVREPLSPLLLGMKRTNLAMELQLAQEYTGHQIDLYTMIPMWKELYEELPADNIMSLAAKPRQRRELHRPSAGRRQSIHLRTAGLEPGNGRGNRRRPLVPPHLRVQPGRREKTDRSAAFLPRDLREIHRSAGHRLDGQSA